MRSFDPDPGVVATGPKGQLTHRAALEHSARLETKLYEAGPGVWTFVGNGLSNQTFVEGPRGIIAIDTGECVEEMRAALAALRTRTQAPIVCVIYTHFHYIGGTQAVFDEAGGEVPVWGHARIPLNLARVSSEVAPAYARGLIHQFGLRLPPEGPDALVNEGLGLFFRNPAHAPYTPGYRAPSAFFEGGERLSIAGLMVEITEAPSDADDSVTIWFPELRVSVQNLVWPTLFNIFPIRGEAYRDPQILLRGVDHLLGLGAEHMVGAHGPPLSGAEEIAARTTLYRDSIQFLWDQTVRGMNRGLSADQMAHEIRLPQVFACDSLTSEFYGVAEHHVRQIAAGVRGWFDDDPARLFPLEPAVRAERLVRELGGAQAVRGRVEAARTANDLRWALELASWLTTRGAPETADRALLAGVLRDIASRTTAMNIRNWCLTRARDVDGSGDLSRLREHRLRAAQLAAQSPRETLHLLRVLLDPVRADGVDHHIGFSFPDAPAAGLHVRNGVAVATDGGGAPSVITCAYADLIQALVGGKSLSELIATGALRIDGDADAVRQALACFDPPALSA